MTLSDDAAPGADQLRSPLVEALILALLVIGLIFGLGVAAGFLVAASKHGLSLKDMTIGAVLFVPAGLCGWQLIARVIRMARKPSEKIAPSVKKVRHLWTFFIAVGLIIGGVVGFSIVREGHDSQRDLLGVIYSNAPISPNLAAIMLAGLLVTCIGALFYYRYIDEHDLAAQESASLLAINVYFALVMGWWIAAKGGLTGPIDHGAVFAAVLSIWCVAWLWRRYR